MNRKLFLLTLSFVIVLVPMLVGAKGDITPKEVISAKSILPTKSKVYIPNHQIIGRGVMINEGFEGIFPPTGWDTLSAPGGTQGGPTPIPWHKDAGYFHGGSYGAAYGWGHNLDGWLRILNLDFSQVVAIDLSFWWESSFYWSVDPNDNADLFVEVSTDGGTSWDTLWTFGDSADVVNSGPLWPWGQFVWVQSTLNLDAYAGQSDVYVAFRVVADDNADIAIDDVLIDTTEAAVAEKPITQDPKSFSLIANTSNPTKGYTSFSYSTTQQGRVSLKVYDGAGRLVRELVDGLLEPAGTKTVSWNGKDENHRPVATGIYFIRLSTENKTATKKMVVVR